MGARFLTSQSLLPGLHLLLWKHIDLFPILVLLEDVLLSTWGDVFSSPPISSSPKFSFSHCVKLLEVVLLIVVVKSLSFHTNFKKRMSACLRENYLEISSSFSISCRLLLLLITLPTLSPSSALRSIYSVWRKHGRGRRRRGSAGDQAAMPHREGAITKQRRILLWRIGIAAIQ